MISHNSVIIYVKFISWTTIFEQWYLGKNNNNSKKEIKTLTEIIVTLASLLT